MMVLNIGELLLYVLGWMSDRRLRARDEQHRAGLRAAAVELGLRYEKPPPWMDSLGAMDGRRSGWRVRISTATRLSSQSDAVVPVMRFEVASEGKWPAGVFVGPRPLRLRAYDMPVPEPPACPTGDENFDAIFDVRGNEREVLLLLTRPAREFLTRWVFTDTAAMLRDGGGAFLAPRGFALDVPGIFTDPRELASRLETVIAAAERLACGPGSDASRLALGLAREPVGVRRRRLALLVETCVAAPETLEACAVHLGDRDTETRLLAASRLGAAGLTVLAEIARDTPLPARLRVRALEAWSRVPPAPADAAALFEDLAARVDPAVMPAVWAAVATLRAEALLPRAAARAREASGAEAIALARALRRLPGGEAEAALACMLGVHQDAVRLEAARALQEIGTLASIEPLLPLAKGLLVDGDVKRAAREAIHAIRARLGPVEAGRLSLSDLDDDAGALSPADDDRGALSPADGGERA